MLRLLLLFRVNVALVVEIGKLFVQFNYVAF